AARAPDPPPAPRPDALAALRGGLGVRLRPAVELARGLHRLPAPQDRGGRRAAIDPDGPRSRVLAAREMTLRRRLALLSGLAVALTVLLASVLVYTLVRDRLRGDIDHDLRNQAERVTQRFQAGVGGPVPGAVSPALPPPQTSDAPERGDQYALTLPP